MLTVVVGTNQRTNEQHRSPSGPHETGQHSTDPQNTHIEQGRTVQVTSNVNTARDGIQGSQQHNEGDVLSHQSMYKVGSRLPSAKHDCKRQQKGQSPGCCYFAEMMVPKVRDQQWHQGNREQNTRKGHTPKNRQLCTVKFTGMRQTRQHTQQHGRHGPREWSQIEHGYSSSV